MSDNKIRIAVDAMGGDDAPEDQVLGAVQAAEEKFDNLEIVLVGKEEEIKEVLNKKKKVLSNIRVVNAEEVVTMHDSPSEVIKAKPNSSLNVALELQINNEADALISAGNTGAVLAASTLKLGRIKGVSRPSIGSLFPTEKNKTMVFDVGATVDCRPNHLYEYALMGSIYMNYIFDIKNPKIGILSVGEEKSKGNDLTLETYKLLEKSNLNFIGNMEGRDVLKGKADVIVCDGFIGNIILKFTESVLDLLKSRIINYAKKGRIKKVWAGMFYRTLKTMIKDFDYQEYGGVPLLGINGVTIIGHGKSTPLAMKNMIFRAEEMVRKEVNSQISKAILQK